MAGFQPSGVAPSGAIEDLTFLTTWLNRAAGRSTTYNAARGSGAGLASALNAFGSRGAGRHASAVLTYLNTGVGRASTFNPARASGAGRASTFNAARSSGAGRHALNEAFRTTAAGRGQILLGFAARSAGRFNLLNAFTGNLPGLHRTANAALDRYELFIGVDGPPTLPAAVAYTAASGGGSSPAPDATATSLPMLSPVLTPPGGGSGATVYHLVLRRRNAWGLSSANLASWPVTVLADASASPRPPAGPLAASVTLDPAASNQFTVRASYLYAAEPADLAAASWLIYLRTNGTNPDPATDTPVVVAMAKADGVARLEYTTAEAGGFAGGTAARVIVRTRRGSGGSAVDSVNVAVIVGSGTASATGPATPTRAGLFLETAAGAAVAQQEG
jgi:hypothetical protein